MIKDPQSHLHCISQGNHFRRGFIAAYQIQIKLLWTFSLSSLPGLDTTFKIVNFVEIQTG
jgi:hypothetical protein